MKLLTMPQRRALYALGCSAIPLKVENVLNIRGVRALDVVQLATCVALERLGLLVQNGRVWEVTENGKMTQAQILLEAVTAFREHGLVEPHVEQHLLQGGVIKGTHKEALQRLGYIVENKEGKLVPTHLAQAAISRAMHPERFSVLYTFEGNQVLRDGKPYMEVTGGTCPAERQWAAEVIVRALRAQT